MISVHACSRHTSRWHAREQDTLAWRVRSSRHARQTCLLFVQTLIVCISQLALQPADGSLHRVHTLITLHLLDGITLLGREVVSPSLTTSVPFLLRAAARLAVAHREVHLGCEVPTVSWKFRC